MSRKRDFARGLSASWVATFVTVGYSLISVPVALHYLSIDEFGLFMIVLQVAGYFALIDLGMSGATARIMIDYKTERASADYGSVILTGAAVFLAQSLILMLAVFLAAPLLVAILAVPASLQPVAIHLLRWMAVAFAVGTAMRIFSSVLYANRRIDLVNLLMSLVPAAGLVLIWIVLAMRGGLWWLPVAFVPPALFAGLAAGLACRRLGLLPAGALWGRPRWDLFREMFALGRDIFMINAGTQILDASQIMIVTRSMGLTAAAVWSVSTKLFTLVFQLVTKIESSAVVIFSEMMARGESRQLQQRFRQIYQMTAGIAVVAALVCAGINIPFVSLWAGRELAWTPLCNFLMALAVSANCITRCHVDLVINSKNIGLLRYVYLLEAGIFVLTALWAGRHLGFPGVIAASVICMLFFRGTYTSWRTARFFGLNWTTIGFAWLARTMGSAVLLAPVVWLLAVWMAPDLVRENWPLLLTSLVTTAAAASAVLWLVALPQDVRTELTARLRRR